jgi:hypothetical protein
MVEVEQFQIVVFNLSTKLGLALEHNSIGHAECIQVVLNSRRLIYACVLVCLFSMSSVYVPAHVLHCKAIERHLTTDKGSHQT